MLLLIVVFIVILQKCDRCSLMYYFSRKMGKLKIFNIIIPILKYGNYKFTLKRNLWAKIKIPTCGLNVALETPISNPIDHIPSLAAKRTWEPEGVRCVMGESVYVLFSHLGSSCLLATLPPPPVGT